MNAKKSILFLFFICLLESLFAQYSPDPLGPKFEQHTFILPNDYDGQVVSTLVRLTPDSTSHKAILYVHGYNDYFFQNQMALRFDSAGYNFYAVDLRKYGRSILSNQKPFNVRSLDEYYTDIDSALHVIKKEGNSEIILMGHSTGGLISALYAEHNRKDLQINALILNSPFLDMNLGWFKEKILMPIVAFIGRWFPNLKIAQSESTAYAESLLKTNHGEWDFNTDWKMPISPAVTAGWLRAIYLGQRQIRKGLHIPVPVLVMHSNKSVYGEDWTPEFNKADAVLDVNDMEKYGKNLGPDVYLATIPNGLHDLILSDYNARNKTYEQIFSFLKKKHL